MDGFGILRYRVLAERRGLPMMNMDVFQLFYNYLGERPCNNVYQDMKQDADYLEATTKETKLSQQFNL